MKTDYLPDLEKLLKMQIHMHGGNSVQVAKVLQRIADLHVNNGDFDTAEAMYRRALTIHETADDGEPQAIDLLREKILSLAVIRDEEDDESHRLRISSSSIPTFTPDKDSLLTTNDVAAADSEIAEANSHIANLKKSAGPQSTAVADALTRLADLYLRKKLHAEMEAPLLDALRIREAVHGSTHLSVATDLKNLARLYVALEQCELAESYLQRALTIREAALGKHHPHVADLAELYSRLLKKLGRSEECEDYDNLVAESRERYGTDWENYKKAGERAVAEGNFFLAQAMWLGALEEAKDFRFDDPRLSDSLENLAQVYWKREKFSKAAPLCRQILQVSEQLLGKDHPDVAVAANNLALVYERMGKHSEASMLYQQAAQIKEKVYGAAHPDVIALVDAHSKARQTAQREIERKVDRASGRFKVLDDE